MGGDDVWNWLELPHGHIQWWVQVRVLLNGCRGTVLLTSSFNVCSGVLTHRIVMTCAVSRDGPSACEHYVSSGWHNRESTAEMFRPDSDDPEPYSEPRQSRP
jgi:hypothetical protein